MSTAIDHDPPSERLRATTAAYRVHNDKLESPHEKASRERLEGLVAARAELRVLRRPGVLLDAKLATLANTLDVVLEDLIRHGRVAR